jgi:hypothetical protein
VVSVGSGTYQVRLLQIRLVPSRISGRFIGIYPANRRYPDARSERCSGLRPHTVNRC